MNPLLQQTIKALKSARRLLNRKIAKRNKGWTQKAFARDAKGRVVSSEDKSAVRFCAEGAIHRVCDDAVLHQAKVQIRNALGGVNGGSIVLYNDQKGRKQEEVVGLFTKAIKHLEKGAS